jgi:hypothetical protein
VSGNPDIQPTWPLLLKTEKVNEILIFFLLNYWANWIQALLNKVWSQVARWFQRRIFLVIVYGRTTDAKEGDAYYFLSMVKSKKNQDKNEQFNITYDQW